MNNSAHLCKIFVVITTLFISACSSLPNYATFYDQQYTEPTSKNCHPSHDSAIVKLETRTGTTASGVVISPNRIITVAHAIAPDKKIYVKVGNELMPAIVIAINRDADLAYLAAYTGTIPPIPMANSKPTPGSSVWAAGYPLASSQSISTGFYESMSNGRLYTSVHINNGNSGGGLLQCEDGEVKLVGVVHGYVALKRKDSVINIGDSISVPTTEIRSFIRRAQPSSNRLASNPRFF